MSNFEHVQNFGVVVVHGWFLIMYSIRVNSFVVVGFAFNLKIKSMLVWWKDIIEYISLRVFCLFLFVCLEGKG